MSAPRRVVPVLALCLALLIAGCAGSVPGLGSTDPAFEESGLDTLQVTEPTCGTPRSSNSSSVSRPVPGGRKLSINTTIPVRSRHAELEASFEELGPHRFELAVERTNGSGVPDCYLETRYNATINLTDDVTERYTLLVTYDGVLVAAYFADPDGSGVSHGLVPESRYAPWARNVTDGVPAGGSGGSGGDTGGGSAGGGGGGTSGGSG
jgi:uncharacterized membrane protein YgcG